ncbi:Putative glycoside hydrolase family 31, galactose mutarotase-like domain superfamily [Colletotrichum destructivum]|uniref:alpha-glucosidase n=1 Tax=Colletotrichum destructivum TaxID=34406 RepID=A0AAX4J148_9PEZI|nr:Putative glycoside hydrolase family 31, galactose mutarotase-like domain superfamily [Colletotrichum destructivum]
MGDTLTATKLRDHFIFKKADDFFQDEVDGQGTGISQPSRVSFSEADQNLPDGQRNPACNYGRIFRFNDGSLLLVQFLRPRVWRIRFDPHNKEPSHFTDYNTRTLIRDTTTELIRTLDKCEELAWDVQIIEDDQYYILQSVVKRSPVSPPETELQLWISRNPFQITAVRVLKSLAPAEARPRPQNCEKGVVEALELPLNEGIRPAVIWKTKPRGLLYGEHSAVLCLEKSITADYMGFGEQGGKDLFKKKTYMNYFNFDNMKYQNVYGQGPLDDREPLYHSEPYWIEVDAQPGYQTQIGTFIDNYSQICVDIGMKDPTQLRVATRFNSFQGIFVAGDSIQEVIQLYTSIVGKPKLKPRYVLGYHQGCYGYDTQEMVMDAVRQYRNCGFPLDGMHIDVDMQDDYRTFTINKEPGHFPNPEWMFGELRRLGVKCSTNITPYISSVPSATYSTLNEGLKNEYFLKEERDLDPSAPGAHEQRYLQYSTSNVGFTNPNTDKPDYWDGDDYNFAENFNKGGPFHGGVYYGWRNGHPGHYPNLNNKEVRKWWGKQYEYLFETGLDFVWQDMTSPCIAEQYGDMKSLPFRLLLDSDGWCGDPSSAEKKKAIEIWSLYSYNLHKATYHGLNHLHMKDDKQKNPKLAWRENRRNFIIGRGSFAGSHRYAGLWTGDNSSTWEFLRISVAQVLALGLGGVTISGADVGGFEFIEAERNYPNPELIIRWYGAYSLLPWFRNHYTRYREWNEGERKGTMRKDGKWFQEPYAYQLHYEQHKDQFQGREGEIYRAVLPTCRYLIRLRYSLMQLLYDAMFENMINGLPIARAMPITDALDRSLFSSDNRRFTSSQYMVRNDLLVAPCLVGDDKRKKKSRKVYLPYPDSWYPLNLRPDDPLGAPLGPAASGGQRIEYDCRISDDERQIPFSTPMYVREGAIIPKIQVRDYVPDPSTTPQNANPITIHIYPGKEGKENTYDMYLDDGISRDSAPKTSQLDANPSDPPQYGEAHHFEGLADAKAKDKYTKVQFKQTTTKRLADNEDGGTYTRRLTAKAPWREFVTEAPQYIGTDYKFVFWHRGATNLNSIKVNVERTSLNYEINRAVKATVVTVPVADVHTESGVDVALEFDGDF